MAVSYGQGAVQRDAVAVGDVSVVFVFVARQAELAVAVFGVVVFLLLVEVFEAQAEVEVAYFAAVAGGEARLVGYLFGAFFP